MILKCMTCKMLWQEKGGPDEITPRLLEQQLKWKSCFKGEGKPCAAHWLDDSASLSIQTV